MEFVVPTILVAFVITGTGDSARIRINFPSLKEEVKRSFIVWRSKSVARKYGVYDPVLPQDLGDVLSNSAYAEVIGRLIEASGLDCFKAEGGELRTNCSALKPAEQGLLLSWLVRCFSRDLSQVTPALFGWSRLPACVCKRRWNTMDGDLEAVYDKSKALASYVILHTGWSGSGVPILRCAATYRKEVVDALGDDALTPSWTGTN